MTQIKVLTILLSLIGFALSALPVQAANSMSMTTPVTTVSKDAEFSVTVSLTADQAAYGGSAVILYPPDDLDFVSASAGNFFTNFNSANDNAVSAVRLHGYMNNFSEAKTGSGTLGTVKFRVTSSGGSGTLTFKCTAEDSETYILNTSGDNILACAQAGSLALTFTSPENPAPTNTPAVTNTPNPQATNTPVPAANKTPDCVGISYLPTGTINTMSKVTITCQGNDNDGYLNGAEFDFGDGNTRIVSSIGGNNNRLVTEYKYTKPGTYGLACKVRDNNNAWSDIPAICRTTVRITASSTYNPGSTKTTPKPTSKTTPTPIPVALETYVAPTPLPPLPDIARGDDVSESETGILEENPLKKILLYAGGGALAIFILITVIAKMTSGPKSNPPVINPPLQ